MSDALSNDSVEASLRCPVCRAVQTPSDVCRRCKCDLSLVRCAMAALEQHRVLCLRSLQEGRWSEALKQARLAYDLSPTQETTRLLAVCHLFCEERPSALATAATLVRFDTQDR